MHIYINRIWFTKTNKASLWIILIYPNNKIYNKIKTNKIITFDLWDYWHSG